MPPRGNAAGWTGSDAHDDEERVKAADITYRETGRENYGGDKDQAEKDATRLRNIATRAKNGAVVSVTNTGNRRNPNWTVIVEVPKPGRRK